MNGRARPRGRGRVFTTIYTCLIYILGAKVGFSPLNVVSELEPSAHELGFERHG